VNGKLLRGISSSAGKENHTGGVDWSFRNSFEVRHMAKREKKAHLLEGLGGKRVVGD